MFLQLCALMITASALPIGIIESDPTTQLSIMFGGMFLFWGVTVILNKYEPE
jgi:hypothetical protein